MKVYREKIIPKHTTDMWNQENAIFAKQKQKGQSGNQILVTISIRQKFASK